MMTFIAVVGTIMSILGVLFVLIAQRRDALSEFKNSEFKKATKMFRYAAIISAFLGLLLYIMVARL